MGNHGIRDRAPRLFKPVSIGCRTDGWRVCWVGGWDKCRAVFVVTVERAKRRDRPARQTPLLTKPGTGVICAAGTHPDKRF
jgi:hypothetical protein